MLFLAVHTHKTHLETNILHGEQPCVPYPATDESKKVLLKLVDPGQDDYEGLVFDYNGKMRSKTIDGQVVHFIQGYDMLWKKVIDYHGEDGNEEVIWRDQIDQ